MDDLKINKRREARETTEQIMCCGECVCELIDHKSNGGMSDAVILIERIFVRIMPSTPEKRSALSPGTTN